MEGINAESRVADNAELIEFIHAFSAAVESHYDWLWQVQRGVVCGHAVEATLEHECGLSHWLASPTRRVQLQHQADGLTLVRAHDAVHAAARTLLAHSEQGPVPVAAYDRFLAARKAFKAAALALERTLWSQTCLIDALTGLRNRHGMLSELREEQQRARRDRHVCVLAMMDIDHFKGINDRHGHAVGDHVLREVTRTAARRLRPYDRIYRYGGEEFLICLPQTDVTCGHGIIERLREEIAAHPVGIDGHEVKVTASFGMAAVDTELAVEESIRRADLALFAAKSNGRNQVISSRV
jgi:diguanylate cyclase (GGDEF)-like protein